jgi:hypothetical protein
MSLHRRTCFLLLSVAVLQLTACVSDVANRYYGGQKYVAKAPGEVQVLWDVPTRPFKVIADFQSRGESPADLRNKAAAIGADAVIVSLLGGKYSLEEQWAGDDRYSRTYTRITGTAIKYD